LWHEYCWNRTTIGELARQHKRSIDWIRKELRLANIYQSPVCPGEVVVVADCVFFGRAFGYLVFRDPHNRKNIYCHKVYTETVADYQRARQNLEDQGVKFKAIVIDGRPGVRDVFSDIPVQMCHFHQKAIINRYLTRNPKLEAGIQLRKIVMTLCNTNETLFVEDLHQWHKQWQSFLKERTVNPDTKRWHYTHKRLRSAYRSLKNNLSYLFTFHRYPELNIPNTTNSLDGLFSHLKDCVRIHRGLKIDLKTKLIIAFLSK
jgi:hypothetical protein